MYLREWIVQPIETPYRRRLKWSEGVTQNREKWGSPLNEPLSGKYPMKGKGYNEKLRRKPQRVLVEGLCHQNTPWVCNDQQL